MSDSYLRLIPAEPTFVPDSAATDDARRRLAGLFPDADEVAAIVRGIAGCARRAGWSKVFAAMLFFG
jgi:hypothetical protein